MKRIFPLLAFLLFISCTRFYPWIPTHRPDSGNQRARSTSIFLSSDRHGSADGNNFVKVLTKAVEGSAVTPSAVVIDGDLVGHGRDRTPEFSVADIYNEMDSVLDVRSHELILTYGSHDAKCTEGYSAFLSGPHRCDGYYVYGVSFAQMTYATDEAASADIALAEEEDKNAAEEDSSGESRPKRKRGYRGLDTKDRLGISAESGADSFLHWVSSLSDNSPILVVSHVPLHAHRGDNVGAETWFKALSVAARAHDILFVWGHNHTLEEMAGRPPREGQSSDKNPLLDRDNYLLVPGDRITLQSSVDSVSVTGRLHFTYVNAGYLKLGYGSVVTFTDSRGIGRYDKMKIERFTINEADTLAGVFGNTGRKNPYETALEHGPLYLLK